MQVPFCPFSRECTHCNISVFFCFFIHSFCATCYYMGSARIILFLGFSIMPVFYKARCRNGRISTNECFLCQMIVWNYASSLSNLHGHYDPRLPVIIPSVINYTDVCACVCDAGVLSIIEAIFVSKLLYGGLARSVRYIIIREAAVRQLHTKARPTPYAAHRWLPFRREACHSSPSPIVLVLCRTAGSSWRRNRLPGQRQMEMANFACNRGK